MKPWNARIHVAMSHLVHGFTTLPSLRSRTTRDKSFRFDTNQAWETDGWNEPHENKCGDKKELVDLSRMLDIRFTLMWRQRMPLLPAHATEIRETGRGMGLLQARHLHLSTNEKQARMHREFGRTNERRPKGRDERRSQVSHDVRSGAYRCVSFVDGNALPP